MDDDDRILLHDGGVSEDDDMEMKDDIPDEDLNCTGRDETVDDDQDKDDDEDMNILHVEYELDKKNTQWRSPLKGSTYPYMESDLVSDPESDHEEP